MKKLLVFFLFFSLAFSKCDNSLLGGLSLDCGVSIVISGIHISPCCNKLKHKFDAVDVDKEENITTKILGDFNLTIKSENAFSGKVYAVVRENDVNISDINVTSWNEEREKNITLKNITKVSKKAYIYIKWDDTTSNNDDGEANSSDDFAIRPDKFIVEIPSSIKAGEEFNITIKALDLNGNAAKDYNESIHLRGDSVDLEYNETKENCKTGELNITDGGEFKDGVANVSLKYSEVGDVNLSILEKSGSEFASVDSDDTDDNQRLITPVSKIVSVGIDHFEIKADFQNYDSDNEFTYYDNDLNISSYLEINITAKNKDNEVVENYNKECYAKDIDIELLKEFINLDKNVSKIKYYYIDAANTKSIVNQLLVDDDFIIHYADTNFTTDNNGSTFIKIFINFEKNVSIPLSPLKLNITQIEVNDTEVNSSIEFNKDARYFYGGILLEDITSNSDEVNVSFNFMIYDNNESDNLKPLSKELIYNWWQNPLHISKDGNITESEIEIKEGYELNSTTVDGVSIESVSIENGKLNINLKRNSSDIDFVVVHLISNNLKWLWYSVYDEEYDISENSTCKNHYCFTVTFERRNDSQTIQSGDSNGTEANVTKTKAKVKIFR